MKARRSGGAGTVDALALAALVAVHTLLARRFAFRIDDAFISFRYARNWADGAGLCYHPGATPPVEGFSNFLWVALLAGLRRLGLADPPLAADVLAQGASLVLVAGTYTVLRARLGVRPLAACLGTGVLATSAAFAVWSSSGLETAAFSLAFAATAALSVEAVLRGGRAVALAAGCAGLSLALLRVEGVLWAVFLGAAAWCAAPRERRLTARGVCAWALPLGLGYGAFLAYRHAHFDSWVANTVHAKAGLSAATLARGAKTTASFFATFAGPLVVLALAPLALRLPASSPVTEGNRARKAYARAALFSLAALFAYDTLVGGDWMPFFRFLAPTWALLAVVATLALETRPRVVQVALGLALAALGLAPAFGVLPTPRAWREALHFRAFEGGYETELARWRKAVQNGESFEQAGRALAQIAAPGDSIVTGAIGAIGYWSNMTVHDRNGLVERSVAARSQPAAEDAGVAEIGTAGHDKRLPWSAFADRAPTFYEVTLFDPARTPFPAAARAFAARIFARDPELAQHSIAAQYLLEPAPGLPPGWALLALRHEPDPRRAHAFWKSL